MNIYILNSRNGATVNDRGLKVSDLYGRQKPVSPFSTSSLNCWTQSRKATMAWSNLLSQKNLRPPEQYKGSSCTKHQTEGKGRIESPEECVNGDVGEMWYMHYLGLVCQWLQVWVVSVWDKTISEERSVVWASFQQKHNGKKNYKILIKLKLRWIKQQTNKATERQSRLYAKI